MIPKIRSIRDFNLTSRVVFIRVDFNVPLSGSGEIEDDTRIMEALPTIQYAMEKGAKIVLASHLGRPDGKVKPELSLEPIARRLATVLGAEVHLAEDCAGEGVPLMAQGLKKNQILILENLRFHAEEEANETEFAYRLSRIAQVYINDAFGTAHRKHASTYGMALNIAERGMGLLIEKELTYLDPLLHSPAKPFYTILGGSKVSDKIKTIEALLKTVDGLLVGGAMAYAFLKAQGKTLDPGAREPKTEDVEAARHLLTLAKRREIPILLPEDTRDGMDIGPKTIARYTEFLKRAKTVFWNGPLGVFEKSPYEQGTFAVAEAVAGLDAIKIVGGGDTVTAIKKSGFAQQFTHLSTGGGAVLEYLEGQGLPGIDVLQTQIRKRSSPELEQRAEHVPYKIDDSGDQT